MSRMEIVGIPSSPMPGKDSPPQKKRKKKIMYPTIPLFILAALLEIAGCFTFWHWLRNGGSPGWCAIGLVALAGFAWVLTRAESDFAGRTYAAYGGIYIVSSLLWLWIVEGRKPDAWDLGGGALCVLGALLILAGPRN